MNPADSVGQADDGAFGTRLGTGIQDALQPALDAVGNLDNNAEAVIDISIKAVEDGLSNMIPSIIANAMVEVGTAESSLVTNPFINTVIAPGLMLAIPMLAGDVLKSVVDCMAQVDDYRVTLRVGLCPGSKAHDLVMEEKKVAAQELKQRLLEQHRRETVL